MRYKAGFIGTGNMGSALAKAAAKACGFDSLCAFDPDINKAKATGCAVVSADDAAKNSDYLFLGVKPNLIGDVLSSIKASLNENPNVVIVSMAAGVSIECISNSTDKPIIRIMPNTPVAVSEGMILYSVSDAINEEHISGFLVLMANAGKLDMIPEKLIDAGSAVSGCGPAFVYMFLEALADGGVACGLPRDKAIQYAAQTVLGAAKTLQETGLDCGALKDAVCSPGGTTIQGVRALESGGLRSACIEAVIAAYKKTIGK